jgi:hypothetical protein
MLRFRQAAALLSVALLLSCGDDELLSPSQSRNVVITQVQVSPDTATVFTGTTVQLRALVFDQTGAPVPAASVNWLSSDAQRALADQGVITGLAEGVVTITAVAGNAVGTATVTVVDQSVPAMPTTVRATSASDTEVDLSWSDNSKNETEFRIERQAVPAGVGESTGVEGAAEATSFEWVQVGTAAANRPNFRDTGLSPGTTYGYRVSACNMNGCSAATAETRTVTHAVLALETTAVSGGNVGAAYSQQLTASGGSGVFSWSTTGGLPPGLVLTQGGRISGTPTEEGDFSFPAKVTSGSQEATRTLTVSIGPILPPVITTEVLNTAVTGTPYAAYLKASQGDGTYAWTLVEGALPPGLTLSGLGYLSGLPTQAGQFDFTVEVESGGVTASGGFTVIVYAPLAIDNVSPSVLQATAGQDFSYAFGATGGDGTYTWSAVVGALPAGLTLSPDGILSGVPTQAGTSTITIQVTSGDGQTRATTVSPGVSVAISTPSPLPSAVIGTPYTFQFEHFGGGTGVEWTVPDPSDLPAGMALSLNGRLSGTPTVAGSFSPFVCVDVFTSDTSSAGACRTFTLVVQSTSTIVTTTLLPMGFLGAEYASALLATGGDGDFEWSVTAGSLPPGLVLDPDGTLGGMPTEAGMFPFGVLAVSGGDVAFQLLTITVSSVDPSAFNIQAVSVASTIPTPAVIAGINRALARWEEIIIGDVLDASVAAGAVPSCQGFDTFAGGIDVDDVVVLIDLSPIDGPSGILGGAAPCSVRDVGFLATTGVLILDSDDLDVSTDQENQDIAFHEIGHILGIGTLWDVAGGDFFPFLSGESLAGDPDPRYIGALAVAQYLALGGTDADIAIENIGGQGTADSHWRETVFGTEIMTGFLSAINPVSVMTVGAMADLGYVVDLGAADDYALAAPGPALTAAERRARGYDILLEGPIVIHDRDGRRVRVVARD